MPGCRPDGFDTASMQAAFLCGNNNREQDSLLFLLRNRVVSIIETIERSPNTYTAPEDKFGASRRSSFCAAIPSFDAKLLRHGQMLLDRWRCFLRCLLKIPALTVVSFSFEMRPRLFRDQQARSA